MSTYEDQLIYNGDQITKNIYQIHVISVNKSIGEQFQLSLIKSNKIYYLNGNKLEKKSIFMSPEKVCNTNPF